ncbi:MAG: hypothetical protein EA384_07465 [Spirochaetaceae bacterium]|nr:MAG: hypothetical protein EA384_07465 [Spirochaetaceae bacterium]
MRAIERMQAVFGGRTPDRTPFVPSIYEHGAALLERTPSVVARDAALMAEAAVAAYETYSHDLVTVGIDVYNVEAEALGCSVKYEDTSTAVPGVVSHPLAGQDSLDPDAIDVSGSADSGNRLSLVADACDRVMTAIGNDVWVYACMGGPFSQAVELRGFENLLMDMLTAPQQVHALMRRTSEFSLRHASNLSRCGVGINIYESWATLPLIDPGIFEQFVVPYERTIIEALRADFATPPPAIIMGGNVSELIRFFIQSGASLIAADYNADFTHIRKALEQHDSDIVVRGCADPKMIERAEWAGVQRALSVLAEKSRGMARFVWGCGCVSYSTSPADVLHFRRMCMDQDR